MQCGPGSSVGIAAGYGLGRSGDWIPVGARFSAPVQTSPGAHPASCTMGTGSLPGGKESWGVMLTPHPLLVPWSWKGRAIPLLPLWAVGPVQSLSACTGVYFSFILPNAVQCGGIACNIPVPAKNYAGSRLQWCVTWDNPDILRILMCFWRHSLFLLQFCKGFKETIVSLRT